MLEEQDYFDIRSKMIDINAILELEQQNLYLLAEALNQVAPEIKRDFDSAYELLPFWINYPPLDRGRASSGTAIPWQEIGETTIRPYLYQLLPQLYGEVRYPGLPSGADIRFMTPNAMIHLDIKLTGPNDHPNEVVASPNQISGDGDMWQNGAPANNPVLITGQRRTMFFQPELMPFYVFEGQVRLCLTFFLKVIYGVEQRGQQMLQKIDLAISPNGLLAFVGPNYNATYPGLFIPGKDILGKPKKRVRVRLNHLKALHSWRLVSISF